MIDRDFLVLLKPLNVKSSLYRNKHFPTFMLYRGRIILHFCIPSLHKKTYTSLFQQIKKLAPYLNR